MDIQGIRTELSIKGKNGLGFLLSGMFIWTIITIIFLLDLGVYQKNIFMLFSTGLMFPVSVGISNMIKADWKMEGNPLGTLGMYLNVAQFMYFPILIWALGKSPEAAVVFFAIITCAHFFPYGWLYDAKPYYIFSAVFALAIMFIGWNMGAENLWGVPLSMVIFLFILIAFLYLDYRKKSMKK